MILAEDSGVCADISPLCKEHFSASLELNSLKFHQLSAAFLSQDSHEEAK